MINWCKGHRCGSIYLVVRLSNKSLKTLKNSYSSLRRLFAAQLTLSHYYCPPRIIRPSYSPERYISIAYNQIKWFNSFSITHFSFDVTRSLAQAHWFSRSTDRFDPSSRFLFQVIFSPLDITMWPLWLASLNSLRDRFRLLPSHFDDLWWICKKRAKNQQKSGVVSYRLRLFKWLLG